MNDAYAELMTTFALFKGYTPHGAGVLISRGGIRELGPQELIFKEGQPAQSVVLILAGHAELFVERKAREIRLGDAGPGRLLGELAVLGGTKRPASARATQPTAILEWQEPAFRRLIATDIDLSQRIFRELIRTLGEEEEALVASLAAVKDVMNS